MLAPRAPMFCWVTVFTRLIILQYLQNKHFCFLHSSYKRKKCSGMTYESEFYVFNSSARIVLSMKSCLQIFEPSADVSDATVRVDARSPLSLVLTIAASLDYVLFLCLRAARACLRVHKLTHTRVHSCYRLLTARRLLSRVSS